MKKLGEFWLDDPRLPDREGNINRIFHRKFPSQPWRAPTIATCIIPPRKGQQGVKLRVDTNRTRKRFWFVASYAPDYTMMADYASTTSAKIADGWVKAVTACARGKK